MSAKKPQTDHGKALAAFIGGWITRLEYQACCAEKAWVQGRAIYKWDRRSLRLRMTWFPGRGKVTK